MEFGSVIAAVSQMTKSGNPERVVGDKPGLVRILGRRLPARVSDRFAEDKPGQRKAN
jgi:hypothetical protein